MISDDQVGLAVTVEVGRRHRDREAARGESMLGGEAGCVATGEVVLSSTDTVPGLALYSPTIKSGLPSPLKSAAVTQNG